MEKCMITFRSVTPAQRGEILLQRAGIACAIHRTPRILAEQGCGYSLRVPYHQLHMAVESLRQKGILYRKTYCLKNGTPEEVVL